MLKLLEKLMLNMMSGKEEQKPNCFRGQIKVDEISSGQYSILCIMVAKENVLGEHLYYRRHSRRSLIQDYQTGNTRLGSFILVQNVSYMTSACGHMNLNF